jgi:hypothetical protein
VSSLIGKRITGRASQVNSPTEIAEEPNNQISWIANDEDIKCYLKKIVHGHETVIDAIALRKLHDIMSPKEEESDLPF